MQIVLKMATVILGIAVTSYSFWVWDGNSRSSVTWDGFIEWLTESFQYGFRGWVAGWRYVLESAALVLVLFGAILLNGPWRVLMIVAGLGSGGLSLYGYYMQRHPSRWI